MLGRGIRSAAAALGAAVVACAVGLAAAPAHAVFLEADFIEADGSFSTVDLWFFEVVADNPLLQATVQVNAVSGPAGSDPDMVVYLDDGSFASLVVADSAAGADPLVLLPAGAYIAVVANHQLAVGEFGPTHADAALSPPGYEYEFNGPSVAGLEVVINCLLSGRLEGGYDKRVFPFGADTCRLPPAAVPEPATLGLLALGLAGLGLAVRRRRPG